MKKILQAISIFISLFLPLAASAGGDHFPIYIETFDSVGDQFQFSAKVSGERVWMDAECQKISVSGTYDALKWRTYKRPMNKANHMEAIKYLSASATRKGLVYFGHLGNGLRKVDKCTYVSKGLILDGYTQKYIVSVHDRI